MRTRLAALLALALALSAVPFAAPTAAVAATTAGTQITNAASAQYSDGSGNSYTAQSNTVTTTVQNVPVVTVAVTNPGNVFPDQTVTDEFQFTNSGNNTGTFSVSSTTPVTSTLSGTGAALTSVTMDAYSSSGTLMTSVTGTNTAQGTSCTGSGSTLATCMNEFLAAYAIVPSGYVQMQVAYATGTSTVAPGNTASDVNAIAPTLSYAATGGASAQTASATGTATDTVQSDALLDLAKTVSQPTNASTPFTSTITFNDRGYGDVQPVSLSTLGTGLPASGVVIADKIPTVSSTPLGLNAVPTFSAGASVGYNAASYQIYYTQATSLGASTAWTILNNNGTTSSLPSSGGPITYVVLVLTPTSGQSILWGTAHAQHGTSTGPGSISAPQGTLTVQLKQPGSGNTTSLTNTANAIIGTNGPGTEGPAAYSPGTPPGGGPPNVLGPGPACYTDTDTTANLDAILNYTSGGTCTNGTITSAPFNGIAGAVLIGPYLNPTANGSFSYAAGASANYDGGTPALSTDDDFTAIAGFSGQSSNATTFATTSATTFAIPNTIQNNGNAADTFTLTATDVSGSSTTGVTAAFNTANTCAAGTVITTSPSIASASAATIYTCVTIASGTTLNLYQPYGFVVTAQSVNDSTATPNTTYDLVYAGGFVKLAKTAAVGGTPSVGSGTCSAGTPLPGCTITYTLSYQNLLPATAATVGLDPMGLTGTSAVATGIASFAVVEDGVNGANANASSTANANKNNWGCFNATVCPGISSLSPPVTALTYGLVAAPTGDSKCSYSYKSDGSALTVTGTTSNGTTSAPSAGSPATAFACVYPSATYLLPSTSASSLTFTIQIH